MSKGAHNKKNTEDGVKNKGGRNVIPHDINFIFHVLKNYYFYYVMSYKTQRLE